MIRELFKPFSSLKSIGRIALLTVIYLLFSLPFAAMVFIPTFTNLRPVTALIPIYGIFFGPAGAWAYAIGNLLYDFFSGTLVISSIGGFLGNFFAAGLFWVLSKRFVDHGYLLGSLKTIMVYMGVSALASLIVTLAVMFWVALFIPGADAMAVGVSIFGNDLFFFLIPGAGISILLSTEFRRRPVAVKDVAADTADTQ